MWGYIKRHIAARLQVEFGCWPSNECNRKKATDNSATNLFIPFLKEVNIMVEDLDKELDLYRVVHALVGYPQTFLQTFHHSFPIMHLQQEQNSNTAIGIEVQELSQWNLTAKVQFISI